MADHSEWPRRREGEYYRPLLNLGTRVQVKYENLPHFEWASGLIEEWRPSGQAGWRDYKINFERPTHDGNHVYIDERYLTTEIEPTAHELAIKVLGEEYFHG